MTYDIFISYRRVGGYDTAKHLYDLLTHDGYNVSFDIDTFKQGDFEIEALRRIDECTDFILILNKEVFDRCFDPGVDKKHDRLRTELAYALEKKKNIIPVMLDGFTEFPHNLPEDISEISNRNGPKFDRYYFNEFYHRLKNDFLLTKKNKTGFNWRKYKTPVIAIIISLAVVAGIFIWRSYREYQVFTRYCIVQTNLMSVGIAGINYHLNISKAAYDEWNKFRKKLSGTKPQDISRIKQEFVGFIETQKKYILPLNPELKISEDEAKLLTRHKIEVDEIKVFYSMTLRDNQEETTEYLDQLILYANKDFFTETIDNFIGYKYQYLEASSKAWYYFFLSLLTTMPEAVYNDFYKMKEKLNNFSEIPLKLSRDEYESMGNAMIEETRNIAMKMGSLANTGEIDIAILESQIEDIRRMFSISDEENEALYGEIIAQIAKNDKLSSDVRENQQELQTLEEQLETSFRNIIENCKLSVDDDQYLMWAKIIRVATRMASTAARRQINSTFTFQPKYALTMDEVLTELLARIDQYAAYFPETKNYIPAVKQFYTDIKNGRQTLNGIVMIGTKDDVPHPLFIPGDIILDRKGMTINKFNDYNNAAKEIGDDTVVFLRLNNGRLQKHTEVLPEANIMTGFLDLKEEQTTLP